MSNLTERLMRRLRPFGDLSAWVLLMVAAVPLLFLDRPMFLTLLQWTAYALALGGISVVLSRVLLPQIRLSELVDDAVNGRSMPAAIIAASVILFLGVIMMSIVIWARA